jgi:hypothetical protein
LLGDDSADVAAKRHRLVGGEDGGSDVDLRVACRAVDPDHGDYVSIIAAHVEDGLQRDAEPCGDAPDERV